MKNFKNKKTLQIVLLVVIAVVTLGIGYAAISAVNLIINGNATASVDQNNFKVHFTQAQAISGSTGVSGTSTIDSQDDTKAMFDVTGLTKVGDYAEAVYTVRNDSNGVGAEISLSVSNSNSEYFKVTETILDDKLQAGEETTAKVRVEMIKTSITDAVSTSITATLTATPLEDAEASGGTEQEEIVPKPISYVYTINGVDFIYVNTDISAWTRVYSSFAAAKAEFGHPAAIANIVDNGKVIESYVAFEKNNKVYYLKGRINESKLAEKPVYEHNVSVLKEAFPDWETTCTDYTSYFTCSVDGFHASAYVRGNVDAGGSGYTCEISSSAFFAQCYS